MTYDWWITERRQTHVWDKDDEQYKQFCINIRVDGMTEEDKDKLVAFVKQLCG